MRHAHHVQPYHGAKQHVPGQANLHTQAAYSEPTAFSSRRVTSALVRLRFDDGAVLPITRLQLATPSSPLAAAPGATAVCSRIATAAHNTLSSQAERQALIVDRGRVAPRCDVPTPSATSSHANKSHCGFLSSFQERETARRSAVAR
jgi:hypothetical protein